MNKNVDILRDRRTLKTFEVRMLPLDDERNELSVFAIPLDLLSYNQINGRISIEIQDKKQSKNVTNDDIGVLIKESNFPDYKKTLLNIKEYGQLENGVVSSDGLVIDGNRRFTCLRELNKEYPKNKDFQFFKAVILTPEQSSNEKLVKALELKIQHRKDKEVDYDPINKIFDAYTYIEDKKLYTIGEYADAYGKTEKEIKLWLEQAELILFFLEKTGHENEWIHAKKLKWQGPIQEMSNFLIKCNNEINKNNYKEILFSRFIGLKDDDKTRIIRKFIKTLPNNIDKLQPLTEKIGKEIYKLRTSKPNEEKNKIDLIQSNINFVELDKECDLIERKESNEKIKNRPFTILERIDELLRELDLDIVNKLSEEEREKIYVKIYELTQKLECISNKNGK